MNILVVASSGARLDHMSGVLLHAYPGAVIERFSDPLMVVKHCLSCHADLILSELDLKRINGVELIDILHRNAPELGAVLVLDKERDDIPSPLPGMSCIVKPITVEKLHTALAVGTRQ